MILFSSINYCYYSVSGWLIVVFDTLLVKNDAIVAAFDVIMVRVPSCSHAVRLVSLCTRIS